MFIEILRWRKQNPTVSLSTVQKIQCFKVLSGKDLLSRFLKEYCLPSVFTKCHLSQEMGVELELKIQAAIKSDPAIWQTSSVNWSEMSFFSFLYMFTNTQKHVHTQIHTQSARLLFSLGIFLQPPNSSVHSLTAAGVLKLQFTVPPSVHCFVNQAILSATRIHRIRQTARSVSSSFAFAFARSLLLPWLCLNRQMQPIPYLSISSTTLRWNPTAALWLPHVNPLEQQRLDSCCWCTCRALDYFTWYFFKLSPTLS